MAFSDYLQEWEVGRGGRLKREGIYIIMADLCCTAETNTTL